MEVLGIGLPELAFIVLIALILLGPKDMVAAGRTLGRALRKFVTSPAWQVMRQTGDEIQKLPTKLMREAGLEELKDLQNEVQGVARQIQPPDLRRAFDERQVFGPSAPVSAPKAVPSPPPASSPNEAETPPAPPSTPDD